MTNDSVKKRLQKLLFYMFVGVLLCLGMMSAADSYMRKQRKNVQDIYKYFSDYVTERNTLDKQMNAYQMMPSDELYDSCREEADSLVATAGKIYTAISAPQLLDLKVLTEALNDKMEQLLSTSDQTEENGFKEVKELLNLLNDLEKSHYHTVNQEICQKLERLDRQQQTLELMTGFFVLLILISMGIAVWDIYKNISGSLEVLTEQVKNAVFDETVEKEFPLSKSKNELTVLSEAFAEMIRRNRQYLEQLQERYDVEQKLYEEKLSRESLEKRLTLTKLEVLRSQMNPHFTFNTLNIIANMAYEERADKTAEMLLKASDYFRYSLSSLGKSVTLREEFCNIRDYLEIQKERFEERLRVEITMEEACAEGRVCSSILQPFVENAIVHGIDPLIDGGTICIKARRERGEIVVEIRDDGVGMDEEQLLSVRRAAEEYENFDSGSCIGIINPYYRMNLFFQKQVKLIVNSRKGEGTQILLSFPYREEVG